MTTERLNELSRACLFGAGRPCPARPCPVRVPGVSLSADVTTASAAGVYHVRIFESLAGEIVRAGSYRVKATTPDAARFFAAWLFGHSDRLESRGFFTWR